MTAVQDKQKFGEALEDFSLVSVNNGGGAVSLSGRMAGKKGAAVLFWSGICSHCVRYDEYLNTFEALRALRRIPQHI